MRTWIVAPCLAAMWLAGAAHTDEASAIKVLQKVGVRFTRDEKKPGKPIVKLDFAVTKLSDEYMKELKEFKDVTALNLMMTRVTDAGLKELKELKHLTTLNLGNTRITQD